jgi:hypothetical protein
MDRGMETPTHSAGDVGNFVPSADIIPLQTLAAMQCPLTTVRYCKHCLSVFLSVCLSI